MNSEQWTVNSEQCSAHNCRLGIVSIRCKLWTEQFKLHIAHYKLQTTRWTLHTAHCTLSRMYIINCTLHCTSLSTHYIPVHCHCFSRQRSPRPSPQQSTLFHRTAPRYNTALHCTALHCQFIQLCAETRPSIKNRPWNYVYSHNLFNVTWLAI